MTRMNVKMALALAAAVAAPVSTFAGELVIAERGKASEYRIVIPKDAHESVRYAAEEFRDWTEKLTGVRLEIQVAARVEKGVYLGGTEDGLGTDGFRVYAKGADVHVLGSPDRGVLYGVYELLETYGGIGWFTSWHTVVPKTGRFAIPDDINDRQIPALELREPFFYDAIRNSEFSARIRKNASLYGSMPKKCGWDRFRAGAGLRGHTFERLLPVKDHFDAHPEYYAEVHGKRQRVNTQLCLTNPDVKRLVASNLLALAATDHGDCWFYAVAHNDNHTLCQCANCRAVNEEEGSDAGTELRFVNCMAEELEKVYPGKFVKMSAYEITRHPPKKTKARHNVFVDLCPIECDFSRPIPESPYKENVAFLKDIEGWAKLTDNLYIFDYVTDFNDYFHPYPNLYALQGNIRFFLKNHVKYLVEEGVHNTPHGDLAELKTWLLAKLMWNPEQDVDKLIDRFVAGFYGAKAAPFVRKYIDDLHSLERDHERNPLLIMEKFYNPAITDGFLDRALGYWEAAEAAVKDDPVYVRHVRIGKLPAAMTLLQRRAYRFCAMSRPFPDDRVRALAADTLKTLDGLGYPLCLGEGGPETLERMKRRWRRFADPSFTIPASDRVTVEAEDALTSWGFKSGLRDDPKAEGGKAFRYSNEFSGDWVTYIPMECFGRDEGAKYRIRIRARIDPKEGGEPCEVFDTGTSAKSHLKSVMSSELGADYRWVDLFEWVPEPGKYVYIAFGRFDRTKHIENPAAKAMWIDQIEIEKVKTAPSRSDFGRVFAPPSVPTFALPSAAGAAWKVVDWRGAVRLEGRVAADGAVAAKGLPPGYWTLAVEGVTNLTFATVVDPSARRQVKESPYAADSGLSWVAADPSNFADGKGHVRDIVDLLFLAGIRETRERFSWNDVQPKPGPIDWKGYLVNAKRLGARGIRTSWSNYGSPKWAGGKGGGWGRASLATNLVAVADFCRRVAEDFGPYVSDFEYLNEPDLIDTAWDAAAQMKAAAVGFRAAKSGVPVTNPSFCLGIDYNYDNLFFANDLFKYIDLFNIHSYTPLADYESFQRRTHAFLEKHGVGGMPILVTECGTDEEGMASVKTDHPTRLGHTPEQEMSVADFIPKSQILRQFGGVWRNHFFVFGSFHERDGKKDWGILRRDGGVKPGYSAFATLTAELDGLACLGEVEAGEGMRAFLYEGKDGQRTLAFWSKADRPFEVACDGPVRLVDWCGTPTTVEPQGGRVAVTAGRHVAYLSGRLDLKVKTPAVPAGTPTLREYPADEDPEVIINVAFEKDDFDIVDGGTAAEVKRGGEGRVTVSVWNLSDSPKAGVVRANGGTLSDWPDRIELPARGAFVRTATFRPDTTKGGSARWRLRGVFGGKKTSMFAANVRDMSAVLASHRRVIPAWDDPKSWEKNNSAPESRIVRDGDAIRMDASWVGETKRICNYDKWCYNRLAVPAEAARTARFVEFEIRSEQDKVENNFACANVYAKYRGAGGERIVCRAPMKTWEKRRVALPSHRRDDELVALEIGANPVGRTVSFFIRNVVIYCADGE